MNEIKSVNTIHNSSVFVSYVDQTETTDVTYASAIFLAGEPTTEWIIDIDYHAVAQDEMVCTSDEKCKKIKGEIKFINPNDPNDKIEFDFCKDSKIVHKGSFDEITLNPTAHNPNIEHINLEVVHEGENAIVCGLFIETNHSEKVDGRLVNYEHLEFTPSIIIPVLTPANIEMMEENATNFDMITVFTTDYYLDSYTNFNPWHA